MRYLFLLLAFFSFSAYSQENYKLSYKEQFSKKNFAFQTYYVVFKNGQKRNIKGIINRVNSRGFALKTFKDTLTVYPQDTKMIVRIYGSGLRDSIYGYPTKGNFWMFEVLKGEITGCFNYPFLMEDQTFYIKENDSTYAVVNGKYSRVTLPLMVKESKEAIKLIKKDRRRVFFKYIFPFIISIGPLALTEVNLGVFLPMAGAGIITGAILFSGLKRIHPARIIKAYNTEMKKNELKGKSVKNKKSSQPGNGNYFDSH